LVLELSLNNYVLVGENKINVWPTHIPLADVNI
jgi:hypothetical protein